MCEHECVQEQQHSQAQGSNGGSSGRSPAEVWDLLNIHAKYICFTAVSTDLHPITEASSRRQNSALTQIHTAFFCSHKRKRA